MFFFFFNDTATTEIYTLSLHDALPISPRAHPLGKGSGEGLAHPQVEHPEDAHHRQGEGEKAPTLRAELAHQDRGEQDRKSTRLNSSHANISYAVFCLKKKKNN